ncbi:hypothetical protein [Paenibacillus radicis (ex Gao et al. 2016)]|uniref:Fungal lipase-like domain-containing protein n=1 Tax=Paenibacillus radicis (ex Gao et al. 2016) TaxID=1737354 RepID=A0A917HLH3_9BACL|nr:hypothetical protein [Paenibacillus radicis (ex Gao et al. 2016)]GGG82523.1 hypothetical protein GCM10010918_44900 [Paenibacillus radicis (ex Gao et al. 2016)]
MTATKSSISIYLLAGVATTQTAFNECRDKLDRLFRSDGLEPFIHILHPYGDASRNLYRQIVEVGSDLSNRIGIGRVGAKAAFRKIMETLRDEDEPTLLIGHSGGGIAAYQAGRMLHNQRLARNVRIVQVGSPRIPIQPDLRDRVSYFHSVDADGKLNDPISRIGSWGGWQAERGRTVPQWNRMKHAPVKVEGIPLIGGHAHYFRHQQPFIDQDAVCNLDKTIDRVRVWLKGWG